MNNHSNEKNDHDWFTHMVKLLEIQQHTNPVEEAAKREVIYEKKAKESKKHFSGNIG